MTEEQQLLPIAHLADLYAIGLVRAGQSFSTACCQCSKLSLREFEAARVRTAQINGCQVCQSFRSERDLAGSFLAFGGGAEDSIVNRGPAPDEAFYEAIAT